MKTETLYCSKPKFRGDSITITGRGDIGHCVYREDNFSAIIRLIVCQPKGTIYSRVVAEYLETAKPFVFESTGVPQLTVPQIRNIQIPKPPLQEQQRIAEALSDMDALIASLEKLIAKKKAIKQGAMQRLLTGKTRLPGFEGEWKRDSLANAITLYNGYAFKSSEYTQSGKYPVITIANVHRGKMVMDSYNTIDYFPSDLQSYQKLVNGDCLISMTGNVGRVCLVNQENCLLNQRVGKIVSNGLYDSDFIYWILNTDDFLETMVELAKGGTQPNVGKNDILGYEFFIPIDRSEQKCIAKIIGDINDEIEVLTQKLDKIRQLKQSVMQQLLTGRIRFI